MRRLREFRGRLRGHAIVTHGVLVTVGLIGMFAAVVGALIGGQLGETMHEDDRFGAWDSDEECGEEREQVYGALQGGGDYV